MDREILIYITLCFHVQCSTTLAMIIHTWPHLCLNQSYLRLFFLQSHCLRHGIKQIYHNVYVVAPRWIVLSCLWQLVCQGTWWLPVAPACPRDPRGHFSPPYRTTEASPRIRTLLLTRDEMGSRKSSRWRGRPARYTAGIRLRAAHSHQTLRLASASRNLYLEVLSNLYDIQ